MFPQKAEISAFEQLNFYNLIVFQLHCNGYCQIFFENLLPNQRFGVEIALYVLFLHALIIIPNFMTKNKFIFNQFHIFRIR